MDDIIRSHDFPSRVHAPLRAANVDRADPATRRQDGTDRAPAAHVLPNHKFLNLAVATPGKLFEHVRGNGVRRVPLVCVGLDDNALVERWGVVLFVLPRVVGGLREPARG